MSLAFSLCLLTVFLLAGIGAVKPASSAAAVTMAKPRCQRGVTM